MSLRNQSILKLLFTMLLVSVTVVYAKQSLQQVSTFTFLWLQMVTASFVMLLYTTYIKKESLLPKATFKEYIIVIAIGLLNYAIVRSLFIYTLEILPVVTHAYIMNFTGLITMLFSLFFLKEKASPIQVCGALIAVVGLWVYFFELPTKQELTGIFWLGLAVVCLALTNILIRLRHLIVNPIMSNNQVATLAIIIGSAPIIITALFTDLPIKPMNLTNWSIVVINGLVAVALVMVIFSDVMRHLKSYEASVLATSGVVFTAVLSTLILGETIESYQVFGIGIMMFGILMVQIKNSA